MALSCLLLTPGLVRHSLGESGSDLRIPTSEDFFQMQIFSEPLVPVGGKAKPDENRDLAEALKRYAERKNSEDVSAITHFLQAHPKSPWQASLRVNLGIVYRKTGYYSKAMNAWRECWELTRQETGPPGCLIADRAVGELVAIYSWVGRMETLEKLLTEIKDRNLHGIATEKVASARQGLWMMRNRPGDSFKCGPYALARIQAQNRSDSWIAPQIMEAQSTTQGLSLEQVAVLARQLGMNYQMAHKEPGAEIITPCVVHWKLDHYGAILKQDAGRYLVQDSTFDPNYGANMWVSRQAIGEEASGYYLVPNGDLPFGWRKVSEEEARKIFGKGFVTLANPDKTGDKEPKVPPGCTTMGMASHSFHTMLVSLSISDTPVGYAPPRGEPVYFTATYNQREATQPTLFNFSNLGRKWNHDWLSFVEDDPSNPSADVNVVMRRGGRDRYSGFSSSNSVSNPQRDSRTVLTRASSNSYERLFPDGAKEIFELPTGVAPDRKVFLTALVDPMGNTNQFQYDSTNRLARVIDALGQTNTLSYSNAANAYLITHVQDPFGRTAIFSYDGAGQLTNITDVVGLNSSFTYGNNDFINALITPYGKTQFSMSEITASTISRRLESIDPQGGRERLMFTVGTPAADPVTGSPAGMITTDTHLDDRNSFYWDKKAMADAGGASLSKARVYHWLRESGGGPIACSGSMYFEKNPLETRVWYNYPGQSGGIMGTNGRPNKIGRLLEDGSTQLVELEYNALGKVSKVIDPAGRTTLSIYETNQIDLLEVWQVLNNPSGTTNTLAKFTYNSQHLPLTAVDAAGQTNSFNYNSYGQITSTTNPKGETTTLNYNGSGYLTNIVGAIAGAVTTFTYDSKGRVRTITDSEGYTITTDYDNLNRVTKLTYPDNSTEEIVYDKLDPSKRKDRLNRWTYTFYNAIRQVVGVQDALGRLTQLEWCDCGSLEKIVDPLGRVTTWIRDVQGRVTDKVYADGTAVQSSYEASGRLKSVKDARNQWTQYQYFKDNNLKQVSYSNAVIATPSVSYTYDTNFNRIATMIDGIGTNTYSYNAISSAPSLGAGMLASVDGPFSNDTISYGYDALGRVITRAIGSSTNTVAYDALGRVTALQNALGVFSNSYVNATTRLSSIAYPNGQSNVFSYYSVSNDFRLKQIQNKKSGAGNLSVFDYEYNVEGQITKWTQQADAATPNAYEIKYDLADQLISAALKNTSSGAILKRHVFSYDKSGNRTSEQIDTTVNSASFNNVNELVSLRLGGSGPMRFQGSLNETARVSVSNSTANVAATVSTNNAFEASFNLNAGSNTVSVVATDYSTNSATSNYVVVVSAGVTNALSYDTNMCLTNDGAYFYEYDARKECTAIQKISGSTTNRAEFSFDGLGRRVRIMEKNNGTVTSDKRLIWCGFTLCEERDSTGGTVNRRYYAQGMQVGSTNYFYSRDHLGSVREMLDSTGTNLVARYDFDLWGRRTKVSGIADADFGFTGHYHYQPSWMAEAHVMAPFRIYRPDDGRWTQPDFLEEADGLNMMVYVGNDPVNRWDPLGLCSASETQEIIDEAQKDASGPLGLWNAYQNHKGNGKFDFKVKAPDETFVVDGRTMGADSFGNYLAGYSGVQAGGEFGYVGVRAGGVLYDFIDGASEQERSMPEGNKGISKNTFDWDQDSVPDINAGADRARSEKQAPYRQAPDPWLSINSGTNHP